MSKVETKKKRIAMGLALIFSCLIVIDFIVITLLYSYSDWLAILVFSGLLIGPAYISNASMVITGGGKPIDGGRYFRDGKRILGDHKTWSGLLGPLVIGIPISIGIASLLLILWPSIAQFQSEASKEGLYIIYDDISYYKYYFIGGKFPSGFIALIIRIILCSYGAVVGDLVGSFCKRRLDIASGQPFWIMDQLDFAVVALIFVSIPALFFPDLFWIPDLNIIIFLIILTPSVSIIANTIAYLIGLKDVPW